MSGMFSVRFPGAMLQAVRQFARKDGVTVSEWIRRLIEREVENPNRAMAVDYRLYPQPQTVVSGGSIQVEWEPPSAAPNVTGWSA